jgi:hypothetical protein
VTKQATTDPTCTILKNILVDVKVEASFDNRIGVGWARRHNDMAALSEALAQAAHDFEEFLRDHRSQDIIRLDVNEVRQNICSHCKREWEEAVDEHGALYCANCGAMVEKETKP